MLVCFVCLMVFNATFNNISVIEPITKTAWVRARLCKLRKGSTRIAAASDKAYQLLAHGRWFSPGSPGKDNQINLWKQETKRHKQQSQNLKMSAMYETIVTSRPFSLPCK
jgi:hypothetical protein